MKILNSWIENSTVYCRQAVFTVCSAFLQHTAVNLKGRPLFKPFLKKHKTHSYPVKGDLSPPKSDAINLLFPQATRVTLAPCPTRWYFIVRSAHPNVSLFSDSHRNQRWQFRRQQHSSMHTPYWWSLNHTYSMSCDDWEAKETVLG